jgi:NAD+ diphosphatase
MPDGAGAAGLDQETGVLAGLSLARSRIDRASHRRADAEWIAAAWADEASRVLVLDHGQALVNFTDGAAELELIPPGQSPDGSGSCSA